MGEMRTRVTIVIVTHNMEHAARVSDQCAFLLMAADKCGELIESGATDKLFNDPADSRTLDYLNGRFGWSGHHLLSHLPVLPLVSCRSTPGWRGNPPSDPPVD